MTEVTTYQLSSRFPVLYKECQQIRNKQNMSSNKVIQNGIQYDISMLNIVSPEEISLFIQYQLNHPTVIQQCFENLIEILALYGRPKKIKTIVNPMDNIYKILSDEYYNITNNQPDIQIDKSFIDKWVLFIKSQGEFNEFF